MCTSVFAGESKEFTLKMTVGVVMATVGFAMFSHAKLAARAAESVKRGDEARSPAYQPLKTADAGSTAATPRPHLPVSQRIQKTATIGCS